MEAIQENYSDSKFYEEIQDLRNMIIDIKTKMQVQKKDHESGDLSKLYEALIKTQMEMEGAKKDSTNPHFRSKYADFNSVVVSSRPYLLKNGLLVYQQIITEKNDKDYLYTRLSHLSGQYIESKMYLNPPSANPQEKGKFITYFKRYAYASLIGVITEDDDCQSNANISEKKSKTPMNSNKINRDQLQQLSVLINGDKGILSSAFKKYNITKLADLPQKDFEDCVNRISNVKESKTA